MNIDAVEYMKSKGFIFLTGEACALSMRVLVDIETEQAKELYRDFLGLSELNLAPPMNRGIGSCMISYTQFWGDLFRFIALQEFEVVVHLKETEYSYAQWLVFTRLEWDELKDKYAERFKFEAWLGVNETRNVHWFSGRML